MKNYKKIIKHYEDCFKKHGDTHLGVDWSVELDAQTRYNVMLDIIKFSPFEDSDNISILDFGCGTAHLLEYINKTKLSKITYSGLDISELFINKCKQKFPKHTFFCGDILDSDFDIPKFDYIILNGVFTEKRELSFDEMWEYFTKLIKKLYLKTNKGIAFNLMSKNVDWERDDLFHVPTDKLTLFITKNLSRNFIIRNDYKLFEFTVYIYQ